MVRKAAFIMNIPLLDHLVVAGSSSFTSFRETGAWPPLEDL
jgi:DNA repair protein RadC